MAQVRCSRRPSSTRRPVTRFVVSATTRNERAIVAKAWLFDSVDLASLTFVLGSIREEFGLSTQDAGFARKHKLHRNVPGSPYSWHCRRPFRPQSCVPDQLDLLGPRQPLVFLCAGPPVARLCAIAPRLQGILPKYPCLCDRAGAASRPGSRWRIQKYSLRPHSRSRTAPAAPPRSAAPDRRPRRRPGGSPTMRPSDLDIAKPFRKIEHRFVSL